MDVATSSWQWRCLCAPAARRRLRDVRRGGTIVKAESHLTASLLERSVIQYHNRHLILLLLIDVEGFFRGRVKPDPL